MGTALALLTSCGGGGGEGGGRARAALAPPTPVRWIAAGDSYSSGAGVAGVPEPCREGEDAMAPRARALLAGDLEIDEFVHVACADAEIDQVLEQVRETSAEHPDERFNLVTLTVGGNDIGFAEVVADCLGEDDLRDRVTPGKHAGCDLTEGELVARVDSLRSRLVPLYQRILDQLAPGGALVVVGYPNLLSDPDEWDDDTCLGVSTSDAAMLRRVAAELDSRIAAAADEAGAVYLSVIDAFDGHEVCGSDDRWMNGISLRRGASFHPSVEGHHAEGTLLAIALRELYAVS